MKMIILGDVHGKFKVLNFIIKTQIPDIILCCGDFGYWPTHGFYNIEIIGDNKTPIYFCDGNHEDFDSLKKLETNEIYKNVFYMKRGSILPIKDYGNVLFFGGASSIDKQYRTPGLDWFPEENISYNDMSNLPDPNNCKIRTVISHTCPTEFQIEGYQYTEKINDTNRENLSEILTSFQPEEWYFGHWHLNQEGIYKNCKWKCLNRSDKSETGSFHITII